MNKKYMRTLSGFAEQLGLKLDSQTLSIFGVHNGYSVCLTPVNGTYQFMLSVSVSQEGGVPDQNILKQTISQSKAISSCKVQGYRVNYVVRAGMTVKKSAVNLQEALETATNYLRQNGFENCCQSCGTVEEDTDVYSVSGTGALLCEHCFTQRSEEMSSSELQQNQKKENLVGGVVGALLGSLLGVAVIVLLGQLGYVAALSGIVLGVCALKGYELLGGRLSTKGIVISIVIMVIMVYVGNRLDWAVSAAKYYVDLDVLSAFRLIPALLREGYLVAGTYYGNLAMVYLFTAVGAVPTIINTLRTKKLTGTSYKMGSTGRKYNPPDAQ